METLNKAQAQRLFEEKAILIGGGDAIPEQTVLELFGADAVAHVHRLNKESGSYCNAYGVGDYTAPYLTFNGFLRAVTYHNIRKLEPEKTGKKRTEPIGKNEVVETLLANYLNSDRNGKPLEEALDAISREIDRQIEAGAVDGGIIGEYELAATRAGFYEGYKTGFSAGVAAQM